MSTINKQTPATTPLFKTNKTEEQLNIKIALPGVDQSTIEITQENQLLTIRAQRKEIQSDDWSLVSSTAPPTHYELNLEVSDNYASNNIEANFKNNILHLHMKAVTQTTRRIEIQ